jgi:hypothetical protein
MANTQKGMKVSICSTPQPTNLTRVQFEALIWIPISNIANVGQSGPQTNMLNFDEMSTEVTQKSKGITDAQNTPIRVARNLADPGQQALRVAASPLNPFNFAVKFEDNDKPTPDYTNTVTYRRGLLTGPTRAGGGNEDFITDEYTLGQNQLEVLVAPEPQVIPASVTRPSITGATLVVGSTLTAQEGTWTNDPTSYTYQWQRDAAGNGTFVNIAAATGKNYVLAAGDLNNAVRVQVTAINGAGSSAVANSLPAGIVH